MNNESKPALDTIQRWMQSVITYPGGASAGIASEGAQAAIPVDEDAVETVIQRSKALSSVERLEVYANAYYARLIECLRSDFPAFIAAVGEETFDQFAFGYLQSYPSQSYTLNPLGRHFAHYLEETMPKDDEGAPAFLVDLAVLEWAISEVFDGPGIEKLPRLDPSCLSRIAPADWPDARLTTAPCLRLLELKYPVHDYCRLLRNGEKAEPPDPGTAFVAVSRLNYVVRPRAVTKIQFAILQSLAAGEVVGAAIERAAEMTDDLENLVLHLRDWFQDWVEEGYIIDVVIEGNDDNPTQGPTE